MAASVAATTLPELIQSIKDGFSPIDSENYYADTIAVYNNVNGGDEFKNTHRSLELLVVNATDKDLVFEEEYFDSGRWMWHPLPLTIASGKSAIMYVVSRSGCIIAGVTGGLRYRIEDASKYVYLGFQNPQAGSYKTFITVSPEKKEAKFGYENANDDNVKNLDVEGYHVQCTMIQPKLSPYKMFQYVIYADD